MDPLEIQYTIDLTDQIVRYFKNEGYQTNYFIVDRSKIETKEGIDFLAFIGDKVIGIQTKKPNDKYHLKKKQHEKIKKRSWAFYAFPDKLEGFGNKNILHRTVFSRGNFKFKSRIAQKDIKFKIRWETIAQGIRECSIGLKITDPSILKMNLSFIKVIEDWMAVISVNMKERKITLITGHAELIPTRMLKKEKKSKRKLNKRNNGTICPNCGRPYE